MSSTRGRTIQRAAANAGTPSVPRQGSPVLVAVKELGPPHSPWLWRQISQLLSSDVDLMYWMPEDATNIPDIGVPVHVVDAPPAPYHGRRRWLLRAANLRSRNFYAARGKDYREIKSLMQSLGPSTLLCYYGQVALRAIDVACELGVPTIAYFHGGSELEQDRWYRWSLKSRARWFAEVVVVNEKERAWMLQAGVAPEKIHVIPCGAPTTRFLPAQERTPGGVRFVMASRLVEQKGCRETIEAFAQVAARDRDVSLDVYGDGPMLAEMRGLLEAHGLTDRVTFHGHIDNAVLADALPRHDVFLQHSLGAEGSPVSIVEAMSCGLAVVTTPVGGNVDLVVDGSTGFIVPERDIPAMAKAMRRLVEDAALRERMGCDARLRAVTSYDATALAGRLDQLVSQEGPGT
jgi:glycosyltransferase involved in cell wall biosynthesis